MITAWTKEEKEYMMALALEDNMTVDDVVVLLNSRFNSKRTASAVHGQKHLILKEAGLTRKNRPKGEIKMIEKVIRKTGIERNSRKGWPTADDKYLVTNWTSNEDEQVEVAKYLGRSKKACQTRLGRLRNHHPELHLALVEGATVNVLPNNIQHYTLLDRLYVGLKNKKKNKAQRKLNRLATKKKKRETKVKAKIEKLRRELE